MSRVENCGDVMGRLGIEKKGLAETFPEFEEVKNWFLYGEIWEQGELDLKLRLLVTVAALAAVEGNDLEEQLKTGLRNGLKPEELQEVFHQAAPYIGFAKAEKGLEVLKKVFEAEQIALPLAVNGTVTEENRLERGLAAQKSIFGAAIDQMRANAPQGQERLQDYLSAFCFGDTYTRAGLDLKTRELLTFVCISCLGGCDSQMRAHAGGNLAVGNSKAVLFSAVCQCLPYIGFPRALNAVAAINEAAK